MKKFILKIRPAILQIILIKLFYGNSEKRRINYFLEKYNLHLFLDPFSSLGSQIIKNNTYEPDTINFLHENLKKNSIFFDIGANEGFFSLIGSRINFEGKTYSFEPQTKLLPILEKNLTKNNIKNCEVINIGIGEKNFTTKINIFPETNTGASSIIKKYKFFNKTQEIKIQTLDSFVLNKGIHGQIDLIKIDVEGYEVHVIKGMKNLLANKKINTILIDYHVVSGVITSEDREKCESFILSLGYKIIKKTEGYCYYKLQ